MPVIITATDFSDIADKAVNYACNMADAYKASVVVLHSYIIPVTFSDTPLPVMPVDEGREIAEDSMKAYIKRLTTVFPNLEITGKVLYGDIVDSLNEYTEEKHPWLIVLGNSAREDGSYLWMGSTVLSALRNIQTPVLAIPPDTVYKPVKTICLAYDYGNLPAGFPVQQIKNLLEQTGASLCVLHVNNEQNTGKTVSKELHTLLSPLDPEYHFIDSNETNNAIKSFTAANHIDWLAVIPHKHSFFEGLFHKSHTKALIQLSDIPVVGLHEML